MALRIRDWDRHFENASSRKLKRLEWVAIPNKMDGTGYTALVEHPDGAAHLGAWYAIVEIASRREVRGVLPDAIGKNPHDVGGICQSLGRISRLSCHVFQDVIPRLLEIGWIEEFNMPINQPVASKLAESANVVGESADEVAAQGREGKGTTVEGNTPHTPLAGGLSGEHKLRRTAKRTTEQIQKALGERLVWLEELWKIYPCHDGMRDGMDAYERKVENVELARMIHRSAIVYAARAKADPDMKVKFLQGWINGERWKDELIPPAAPKSKIDWDKV